jgi:hypothetical protein
LQKYHEMSKILQKKYKDFSEVNDVKIDEEEDEEIFWRKWNWLEYFDGL